MFTCMVHRFLPPFAKNFILVYMCRNEKYNLKEIAKLQRKNIVT